MTDECSKPWLFSDDNCNTPLTDQGGEETWYPGLKQVSDNFKAHVGNYMCNNGTLFSDCPGPGAANVTTSGGTATHIASQQMIWLFSSIIRRFMGKAPKSQVWPGYAIGSRASNTLTVQASTFHLSVIIESGMLLELSTIRHRPSRVLSSSAATWAWRLDTIDACHVCHFSFRRFSMLRPRCMSRTNMLHLWENCSRNWPWYPYYPICLVVREAIVLPCQR